MHIYLKRQRMRIQRCRKIQGKKKRVLLAVTYQLKFNSSFWTGAPFHKLIHKKFHPSHSLHLLCGFNAFPLFTPSLCLSFNSCQSVST